MNRLFLIFTLLAAALAAGCSQKSATPAADTKPAEDFGALAREYTVYSLGQFPVVATYLGGSAFDPSLAQIDGRLRDNSPEALRQEDARWNDFKSRLAAFKPESLSPGQRIDHDVALAQIGFLLRQHEVRRHQERSLDTYVDEPFRGVDFQQQGMTSTGAATYGTDAEWQMVIMRVRAIPAFLTTAEKQIAAGVAAHNTPDWRVLRQYGLDAATADAEYFSKTLPEIARKNLSSPNAESLLKDLHQAGADAAAAYMHLHDYVASTFFDDTTGKDAKGVKAEFSADRYAFGDAEYNWALHNNLRVDTTAEELFTASWPIVEATRESMVAVAREITGDTKGEGAAVVSAAFDKLSRSAPKNDEEMVEGYRKTGVRIVGYARQTGLFDVPADYRLDVTVTPPPLRASLDGAAYYTAPPFKKTGVGRFYVTPTDNDQAKLHQEHNYAAMADLAAHEGFPGHDWNFKVMAQYADQISPLRWLTPGAVEDSSSMWEDSIAGEGWALYSESLLAEPQPGAPQGFYSPGERLYQLRGKLYRDLRVRIDTGIHTGRLGFEDAVTLFSEVVDFLPGACTDGKALAKGAKRASCDSARRAITRYSKWPTQALTYRLGKDQILALRERAQKELGDKFSLQRFHIEFMKQGSIPVAYFGDELMTALKQEPAQ